MTAEPLPPPRRWAVAALAVAMGVFIWCVGGLAAAAYRLYCASWDLAIFDQATWLVAHGRPLFMTARNMTVFSHHLNLLILPLAGLYRLQPGPLTLIYAEVVAVAVGAVPVFLLARSQSRQDAVALVWAVLFLNYPGAQYMLLHDFHFEPLAVPLFLFALWFAHGERWRPMALMLVLAACAKEDAGLVVACFGLGLAGLGHRRVGLLTAVCGLLYTLVAIKLVMPLFSSQGGGAFYTDMYFGHLGKGLPGLALAPILRPAAWWESLTQPSNARLLVGLLGPVAFLGLAKPSWLAGGLGLLYLNMLGTFWPTHTIEYHYQGFVLPFVFAAAVGGGAWLTQKLEQGGARPVVALVTPPLLAVVCTCGAPWFEAALANPAPGRDYALWFPATPTSPLRRPWQEGVWRGNRGWAPECDRLVARIPREDSVAASILLLHHVSARPKAYLFPCPFYMLIPGFEKLNDFTLDRFRAGLEREPVDWLLLQTQPNNPNPLDQAGYAAALQEVERSGRYHVVEDIGAVRLYRRVK